MQEKDFLNLLKDYQKLNNKAAEIDEQKADLKAKIQKVMEKGGHDKVESDFGTFSLVGRKTWKYSEEVSKKEETLKKLKTKEQEEGIAKYSETKSITYYPVKA